MDAIVWRLDVSRANPDHLSSIMATERMHIVQRVSTT